MFNPSLPLPLSSPPPPPPPLPPLPPLRSVRPGNVFVTSSSSPSSWRLYTRTLSFPPCSLASSRPDILVSLPCNSPVLRHVSARCTSNPTFEYTSTRVSADRFKEAVVEERRKSAEALMRFATSSPHLAAANTLRNFLAVSGTISLHCLHIHCTLSISL